GGDAVPQVRRPADDVTLDHRDLGPQPGGGRGGGVAGRTATEDDEAEGHGPRVPAALAPTAVAAVAPGRDPIDRRSGVAAGEADQAVVGSEQAPGQPEADDDDVGGDGPEDQVHDRRLHEHGLDRVGAGEDE